MWMLTFATPAAGSSFRTSPTAIFKAGSFISLAAALKLSRASWYWSARAGNKIRTDALVEPGT